MNAAYLRERKNGLKMSYDVLASLSGISRRACIGILNEEEKYSNPTQATIQAIERALGINEAKKEPPEELNLTDGEKALLIKFSRVPAEQRTMFFEMLEVFLKNRQ